MLDDDIRELLAELSKNAQAAGRMLQSPKTDVNQLQMLAETFDMTAETARTIRRVAIMRQE